MYKLNSADFKQLPGVDLLNLAKQAQIILGICTDSRSLKSGEVFWALEGEHFNGHDFVEAAQKQRPLCCVISQKWRERFATKNYALVTVPDTLTALQQLASLQRQKFSYPVLALSGSNGKTSTKDMIAAVLSKKFRVLKTEGNLNNHIGCPLTLLRMGAEHQVAIIELGSNHPGEIADLAQIVRPNQALLTNIGAAHLEFFKDLESVAREKLSLFDAIPASGALYQNIDDPFIKKYKPGKRKSVSFAVDHMGDVKASDIKLDAQGNASFLLQGSTLIHLHVPGLHNMRNALAAAAVGLEFGVPAVEIKDALEEYSSTGQRMQMLQRKGIRFINDAYNANPASMMAAFEALKKMKNAGSVFIVLGDMLELGEQSASFHGEVLEKALQVQPRRLMVLGKEMHLAAGSNPDVDIYETHEQIVAALKKLLRPDDLVLIKGSRSMQMEKILDGFK